MTDLLIRWLESAWLEEERSKKLGGLRLSAESLAIGITLIAGQVGRRLVRLSSLRESFHRNWIGSDSRGRFCGERLPGRIVEKGAARLCGVGLASERGVV